MLNECIPVSNCNLSLRISFKSDSLPAWGSLHSERIRWLVFLVCRRLHGVLGGREYDQRSEKGRVVKVT